MYEQINLFINETMGINETVKNNKEAINFIKRNFKNTKETLKVLSEAKGKKYFLSRLTTKDIMDFLEVQNGLNLLKNPKTRPMEELPKFNLEPTTENFKIYFDKLKDLGFATSTINRQVTMLRKEFTGTKIDAYDIKTTNNITKIKNHTKRLLNIKVSTQGVMELLFLLENSNNIHDNYLFLAITTGRRENEILGDINNFDFNTKSDYEILFKGQSKLKGREKIEFIIPCLVDKSKVKKMLEFIHIYKQHNRDEFLYLEDANKSRVFNSAISKRFKEVIKLVCSGYSEILKPHNCRSIYAMICNHYINNNSVNELTYYSNILGHDNDDTTSQNHYKLITVIKDIEKIEGLKIKDTDITVTYKFNKDIYNLNLASLGDKQKEKYKKIIDGLKDMYKFPQMDFRTYHMTTDYNKLAYDVRKLIKSTFERSV